MKNILIITSEFPPGPGGMGNQAYNIATHLSNQGYHINIYAASRAEYKDVIFDKEHLKLHIKRYAVNSPVKNLIKAFLYIVKNNNKNDVVFLSGTSPILLTLFIKWFTKWKTIAIIHGHEILMARGQMRRMLKRALYSVANIITVSDFAKRVLLENTNLRPNNIVTISNGVPLEKFGSISNIARKQPTNGTLKLLTVGSLTPRKGQHNVVNALPIIKKIWGDVEYHMVGIPQEAERIKNLANQLGVQNSVYIHGMLSNEDLFKIMLDTDVFIMLSETASDGDVEGFGIAIIEANLLGIPAIGSKGCGIEGAISNQYNGYLVDPKNADDIANAINSITVNYAKYSNNAISWAKQHDWNILIEDYIKVINS